MGILERCRQVRTLAVPNRKKHATQAEVRKHVEAGAALYTDALLLYEGWRANTPTLSWITPSSTSTDASKPKALRTFGRC